MSARAAMMASWLAACGTTPPTDTPDTDTEAVDSDDTPMPPDTDVAPDCDLGTGESAFEPWPATGELPVIRGPQGGWHVLGSVRCQGIEAGGERDVLDPRNPTVSWTLDDDGGNVGGYLDLKRPMAGPDGPGLVGEFIVIWTSSYETAIDRDVTMTFDLRDVNGVHITRSRPVRLVSNDPPPDTADTDPPAR